MKFLETDRRQLKRRTYNYASFSTSPEEWEAKIRSEIPDFKQVVYEPDFRQSIANSWPAEFDCSAMKQEVGMKNQYDLEGTVKRLIEDIREMKH